MITDPYLLVLNVPLHLHRGEYWADPLWKRDLEAHRVEIAKLRIACPVQNGAPPDMWEALAASDIVVHPLPAMGRLSYLLLPYLIVRLWQAVSSARIVHTGVAGWPFPLGWIAVPIARMRHRFVVIVVESAFWRIPPGVSGSALARAKGFAHEIVSKAVIRRCDIAFFTTDAYRDTLHRGVAGAAHVLPAVWVDDEALIPEERLADRAAARRGRFLFAGRLTAEKGVGILLEAVRQSRVPVDIVGEGEMRDAVLEAQRDDPDLVRLIDPVGYGAPFSALLDGYAAVVVPTISDEQPRIVFDAFARGVPVLASATSGNRQVVEDGRNGLLYAPNDAKALAAALVEAARDPASLQHMGVAALRGAATQTHRAMHATRARAIADALAA